MRVDELVENVGKRYMRLGEAKGVTVRWAAPANLTLMADAGRLEQVLVNLRDSEFDAPQGRVRIDPENNHTYLWPRIARLDRHGRFQTIWNPGVRVKPDPYCVVQSLDDWSVDDLPLLHP